MEHLTFGAVNLVDADSLRHNPKTFLQRLQAHRRQTTGDKASWEIKPLYISLEVSRTELNRDLDVKVQVSINCPELDFHKEVETRLQIGHESPHAILGEITTITGTASASQKNGTLYVVVTCDEVGVSKANVPVDFD